MHFLAGVLIVLAIIYFMIVSPGFRAVAIVLLVGVVVLIAVAIHNNTVETEKRDRERAIAAELERKRDGLARSLIAADRLALTGISLKKDSFEWKFSGTVKNNSEYILTEIRFRLTISDCAQVPCIVIGESDAQTSSLTVPPGQARAFLAVAMFKNLPPSNASQWTHNITGTRGLLP
jgi:hypothetical protein